MDELEQQAQNELNAIYSGINEWETEEQETLETETHKVELGEQDTTEQEKPKTKAEKNFEKILSEKNKAKAEKESLASRVSQLESMLAEKDFLAQYPQAWDFMDDIKAEIEETPWLTMEKAFKIVAQDKGVNNRPKGIVWRPPSAPVEKWIESMSSAELTKLAIESGALGKALSWE